MRGFLLVCLGGAFGSGMRFLVATAAVRWLPLDFPYGTLTVNLVGSFAIGVVQELAVGALLLPEPARLLLSTGVLGGFTTYSAFSYETVRLMTIGSWTAAVLNVVVTTTGCLTLCVLGIVAARQLTH